MANPPARRLLFVDDESRLLEGIQRMLRPMRNEWTVLTATSGVEALDILAREPVDVVISDMRMPGMTGADLLHEVMRRHPHTVRIILSGQTDATSLLRSLDATHLFLTKPCDCDRLRSAVAKACALRDLLGDIQLQTLVTGLATIPSLPTLYQQIQGELTQNEPSIHHIGKIVEQDMGMSAKILQLVNSARFGLSRQVGSAAEAVSLIGIGTVKSMVLGAHVFSVLDDAVDGGLVVDWLWKRSTAVASLARSIALALKLKPDVVDMSFTAGLLHDCGMLVLAVNRGADYLAVAQDAPGMGLCAAEQARFSADHAAVGAYLLGLWGLPEPIVEAVAFHHRPSEAATTGLTPCTVVHLAAALVDERNPVPPLGSGVTLSIPLIDQVELTSRLHEFRELANHD